MTGFQPVFFRSKMKFDLNFVFERTFIILKGCPANRTGERNEEKYNVGIIGCTGMVGQRFATLLENHPWFNVTALAAPLPAPPVKHIKRREKRWENAHSHKYGGYDHLERCCRYGQKSSPGRFCILRRRYEKKTEIRALEKLMRKRSARSSPTTAQTAASRMCRWLCRRSRRPIEIINAQKAPRHRSAALSP